MFKRILAVILSISMILGLTAVFTISAFAMEAPVFEIKKISSDGNRLVASINLTTGAFNAIDISFKTSGLKCVSIRDGSDLQSDAMTGRDTDPAIGVPNISIVSIDGYERQGEMYVVTFNILSDEYSFDLDITSCIITKDDGSNADVADSVAVSEISRSITSPYLQFYIDDGEVSVDALGTDEISGKVTVPAVYNGYPVTRICDAAFMGCDQITEIVLPDSITFISDLAFSYCSNLKSINIPQNVTMVEQGVFDGCINLTNIDIADDATGIRADCGLRDTAYFKDESNWENGVLYIGKHLISTENCTLESYSVKEGTRDIICARGNIKNLSIPSSVTSIDHDHLDIFDTIKVDSKNKVYDSRDNCNALIDTATDTMIYAGRNAKIPNTVKNIGSGAFYCHNELKNIIIPQNIVNIGDSAFANCESLITAYISDGVKNIGVDAFSMCDKLEDVRLPESISSIESFTFYECKSLENITLPKNVQSIGREAFLDCTSLENMVIPENVSKIDQSAFYGCSALKAIKVDASNKTYDSRDNCNAIIESSTGSLLYGCENSFIPNGVTKICSHAFGDVTEFNKLVIPNSVIKIENDAFNHYNELDTSCAVEELYIGNNVDSLENLPIGENLKTCIIGSSITEIPDYCFSHCHQLANISIPNSVTKLGYGAFYDCKFSDIKIPNKVSYIPESAFFSCDKLKSISIPSSVTNIDKGAFRECDNLKDVYYQGSKEDWKKISIEDNNYDLLNATIHYNNEKTYTVEYNKTQNGGIGQTETRNLDKGEKVDLTLTAAKSGWDFIGWNTDPNAKTGLTSLSVENNNIVLYAIYKKDLTATFIDYSGTAKKTRTVGTTIYNNSTSGKINAPAQNSYTGWTKRGWAASTSPDANVTGTFSISSDTTYYGLYQKTLKLSYNANGGSNVPSSQSGTQYTNSYSISTYKNPTFTLANAISKQGSTFTGWALGSINGKIYGAGSKITINSNSTMYAAWKNTENIYNLGEETYSFSNFVDEDSYGHCFGMAVTSSGYYLGALNKSIIGGQETSSLYSFSDTAIVRKPICYYMNIQGAGPEQDSMVAGGSIDLHNTINIKADWNSCVNYVKNHEHDNKGDLNVGMWFAGGNGGHAVNFLYYKEVNGQQRIYVYDNNFPETETYYYMGSDGYVYQAPLQTTDIKIVGIDLIDVNQYFVYAKNFNSRRYIYANKNEITVDGAKAYPMKCGIGQGQYTMYEIPENSTKVYIRPLVDNASFKYNDKIYSFNDVDSKTCGILTVPVKGDSSDQTIKFNIVNDPKVVKSILVSDITLNYKNSANIKLKITADEGAEYIVKYESSNPKVATVDENGKVYAAKRGEATITCTVTDSYGKTVSDTCKVTVNYTFWQWLIKIILFGWIWY